MKGNFKLTLTKEYTYSKKVEVIDEQNFSEDKKAVKEGLKFLRTKSKYIWQEFPYKCNAWDRYETESFTKGNDRYSYVATVDSIHD